MKTVKSNTTLLKNIYDCYRKKGVWQDGTILPQHERESVASYARRCKSFYAPGLYSYFLNTFDAIWAREPVRNNMDSLYEKFTWSAGYDMSLNNVLKRALKVATALGSVFLVMDTDKDQDASYEQMIASRTYPFLEIVLPQAVQELVVDRVGRLIKFSYNFYDYDDERKIVTRTKTYTLNGMTISDSKGKVLQKFEGNVIPVIPVVPSREPLETSEIPASPTINLYQGELDITINRSLINQQAYSQLFSILVLNMESSPKPDDKITTGAGDALVLGVNDKATFIAPSSSMVDTLLKNIESDIVMMTKTFANLLTAGEAQSGVAKIIDRQVGTLALKDLSSYMMEIEYKIYELFSAFTNSPIDPTYSVEYAKDFDMVDITAYVDTVVKILNIDLPDDVKKEVKANLIKIFFADKDPDSINEVIDAVKKENKSTINDVNLSDVQN